MGIFKVAVDIRALFLVLGRPVAGASSAQAESQRFHVGVMCITVQDVVPFDANSGRISDSRGRSASSG